MTDYEKKLDELLIKLKKNTESVSAEALQTKYKKAYSNLIKEIYETAFQNILTHRAFYMLMPKSWAESTGYNMVEDLCHMYQDAMMKSLYEDYDSKAFLGICDSIGKAYVEMCQNYSIKNGSCIMNPYYRVELI